MLSILDKDKGDQIFTSLSNGDIRTQFKTRDSFTSFIKYNNYLDYDVTHNLLSTPGTLKSNGINIIVFQKKIIQIKKMLEKEQIREDFTMLCQDDEDVGNIIEPKRDTIFLLKENKNFYPIVLVIKDDEESKNMDVVKIFTYENKENNIVNHIRDFYEKNCQSNLLNNMFHGSAILTAKALRNKLIELNDKNYLIKYQNIDMRNKCKYIVTQNNLIIPVQPSGSLYNVQLVKNLETYVLSLENTLKQLKLLYDKSNGNIPIKPIGVYYCEKKSDTVKVIAVMTEHKHIIPVTTEDIEIKWLHSNNLIHENRPLTDKIDNELIKGKSHTKIDDRTLEINKDLYENESYELFRLEFSEYINRNENLTLSKKIENLILSEKLNRLQKIDNLRLILYRLIDKELYNIYKGLVERKSNIKIEDIINDNEVTDFSSEQEGGKYDKLISMTTKYPDLSKYAVANERFTCSIHRDKDECNANHHCHWKQSGCYMSIPKSLIIVFVNKLSEELALRNLKAFEVMKIDDYYVSDIVNYDNFTERAGQKIIRSSSSNIANALNKIFGSNTPTIGRKREKQNEFNYMQLNIENPMLMSKDTYIQTIIPDNYSIFRGYSNCYFWINNKYIESESRNLGYYSLLQTELSNYFKSLVIEWMRSEKHIKLISHDIGKYITIKTTLDDTIRQFAINVLRVEGTTTNCVVELYVLSKINKIPIIVLNQENEVVYTFSNGMVDNKQNVNLEKSIVLRLTTIKGNDIPIKIESIYSK
jgi:hypothetical protein